MTINLQEKAAYSLLKRPRRNRKSKEILKLLEETRLLPSDLVAPYFLLPGLNKKEPLPHLPGIYKLSIDLIAKEVESLHKKGLTSIILFPIIDKSLKDAEGSEAVNPQGLVPEAVRFLKQELPQVTVMTDIALDPYTTHGHDGLVSDQKILNDETIEVLIKQALVHAEAGVDIVAPSDMMDGRVKAIREALDVQHYKDVSILSYSAKYASGLYGPYRLTLDSGLAFGDKSTYQLNPSNIREALLEAKLDEEEGADMLLVKPATYYLDVISKIKEKSHIPVGGFHVGGEYCMIMLAHEKGYIDGDRVLRESLVSIKRAGADFILTYGAKQLLSK